MISAIIPENENKRLEALKSYNILDTLSEEEFDNITKIAAQICDVPICLISLIDEKRQYFKSHHGLSVSETPREFAFCAHAINKPNEPFIVNDSRNDERFFDNPLVVGDPKVIFYAGIPLLDSDGFALGTLCAIDNLPRELKKSQIEALQVLAKGVMTALELRRNLFELKETLVTVEKIIELSSPFYFILKDGFIVKYSDNILKTNQGLKTNNSFFEHYKFVKNHGNLDELLSGEKNFSIITNKEETNQFKVSGLKILSHDIILASPVINQNYKMESYNLDLNDFPIQDYISEYLMLQNVSINSIKDAKMMMALISKKNTELNDQLNKITNFSRFTQASPSILFVFDLKSEILFSNTKGESFITSHNQTEFKKLTNLILKNAQKICYGDSCNGDLIYFFREKTYSINYTMSLELEEVIVYAADITAFVNEIEKKSKDVVSINESLEKTIQKEVETNAHLRNENSKKEILSIIGELTAGFAHDLNTPLSAILHGTDSLSSDFRKLINDLIWEIEKDDFILIQELLKEFKDLNILGGLEKMQRKKILDSFYDQNGIELTSPIKEKIIVSGLMPINSDFLLKNYKKNNFEKLLDTFILLRSMKSLFLLTIESAKKGADTVKQMKSILSKKNLDAKSKVNLYDSLNKAILLFRFELKHVTSYTVNVDQDIFVFGFESDIFQIWANLIKNAIEALSDNVGDKTLNIYSIVDERKMKIVFENNGPMIPASNKELIFRQFYTTKNEKGGTGLGLSIIKNMAIRNQAKIEVESDLNSTKFTLIFDKSNHNFKDVM